MKNRFSSSDKSTLKQYYRSCANEALERGKKKEHKRYIRLIKEIEEVEDDEKKLRKSW